MLVVLLTIAKLKSLLNTDIRPISTLNYCKHEELIFTSGQLISIFRNLLNKPQSTQFMTNTCRRPQYNGKQRTVKKLHRKTATKSNAESFQLWKNGVIIRKKSHHLIRI